MDTVNKDLIEGVPIVSLYHSSIKEFRHLAESILDSQFSEHGARFKTQFGRFIVWGENEGAHRSDRMSLDYRLREASHIRVVVARFLQDLIAGLKEGMSQKS